jgi:arylsulfatase A-like enzyme
MSKERDKSDMTRKEAIKQMGGLALGGTAIFSAMGEMPTKSDSSFPNIITKRASKRPNILWITGEGVPISVLSSYQNTRWGDLRSSLVDTPNLDRIAEEGMLFENSFCTNALCAPSRATLLTGKYNHENGVTANFDSNLGGHPSANDFDASQQTFPKIMQSHGYQTATIGKWHLHKVASKPNKPSNPKNPYEGNEPVNPAKVGFDKFAFKTGAGGPYYNSQGYLENPHIGSNVIKKKSHKGYITDVFTDIAIQTMKDFNQPFLMMMQFFNDHRPFDPPHKYKDLYSRQRITEPSTFWDDYKTRSTAAEDARMRIEYMPDWDAPENLTERQRKQYNYQKLMKHFLGTFKAQDDNVGRLLHFLEQSGLADNTIVVYTADHGFFLGEHGWFDKRFMYEQALRVPFMIRYPGRIRKGSRTDLMGLSIDNAPTALDLAGLPIPGDMQGKSLKPILQGKRPDDWRTSMYYHYYEYGPPHWVLPNYGVRTERYKIINYYTENQWELFDLNKDPDEMENLFKWDGYDVHSGYKKTAHNLVEELKQMRKKYDDNTGQPVRFWPTSSYD